MKNWYIVQSHSNFENKVAKLIKEEAKKSNISEKYELLIVSKMKIVFSSETFFK